MSKMRRMRTLWVCIVGAVLFFLNSIIEYIPIRLSTPTPLHSDFAVLCYNVKCSDEDYQGNQISIAYDILEEKPDVVFLCEFNRSVSKGLDSIMTQRGGYKSYYRSGANCIFYSKYDIDSIVGIDTGTSKGKKALNNLVHVMSPTGCFTIVGCHLSSSRKNYLDGRSHRASEADSIYEACMKEKHPLIVMGDMNDISGSYVINRLKDVGLKDAWWEGGCGYGATFHADWLRLRIDHILFDSKRLELVDVKVIDNNYSDHNAITAKFMIR